MPSQVLRGGGNNPGPKGDRGEGCYDNKLIRVIGILIVIIILSPLIVFSFW